MPESERRAMLYFEQRTGGQIFTFDKLLVFPDLRKHIKGDLETDGYGGFVEVR